MRTEEEKQIYELGKQVGEIKAAMGVRIFHIAMVGSDLREMVRRGLRDQAIAALDGDELLVQRHVNTTERLEKLIRDGHALSRAIDIMIREGFTEVGL